MSIPKGYAGNVIIIDLSKSEAEIIPTDKFWREYDIDPRLWLGGDGFITKILWKDFPEAIDPMSSENEIIIATGPWTATAAPQAGRAMLGCISPETGGFSSGGFGWYFPATLKYAGFDIMIVRGKAAKPTYVFIDDKEVTFRDASHIWGKETGETVKAVRDELGERYEGEIRVLSISIAGEHLVKYAVACGDATSCPGRSGGGAIMGSKNLKAIAVRGTGEIQIHDSKGLIESSYEAINKFLAEEPTLKIWREHGCTTSLATVARWPLRGTLLAHNRAAADFPHLKNVGCLNCFAPCYHWLQLKEGRHAGVRQIGGHMTFLTTLLRNLDIADFNEWVYYERLIQELGLDAASFSMNFAFAVDLFERGLLTLDDTDGLVLKRGDPDLVWDVAGRVARRQGKLGNLLAEGQGDVARIVGGEALELTPAVKGKPSIQRDSRIQALMWSMGYLTSPRGGDWLRTHNTWELAFLPENRDTYPEYIGKTNLELYEKCVELLDMPMNLKRQIFGEPPRVDVEWIKGTKGKMLFTVWTENFVGLFNSLVTCMFGAATQFMMVCFGPSTYAEILNKITGWDVTYDELMFVGERVFNLQRAFNYRLQGWDYQNDRFHDKRAYEPAVMGIYKGKVVPWDEMLQEYYAIRGWTKEGIPTAAKMNQLKMDDVTLE
ncbi:MAG: aldehyde ferredoxin oxidoreductase C-terminal domain-containing protein [Dehalococcoidia bacterium]